MTDIDPRSTALLVMDYQAGILGMLPDEAADALLERAERTLDRARAAGVHIGFVRVGFTDADVEAMPATAMMAASLTPERRAFLDADAPTTAVHPRVAPRPGDIEVRKTRVGAFSTTDLDARLRERGVNTLLLAGISTSGVVLSTVRDAADRDYRVRVLADLCADPDPEVHEFLTGRIYAAHGQTITTADLDW
ncbi:cysteine hydrolase family protein [Saccharopolyspora flava]|uniref:Nicotinamidase-related amidase n=1 Tax=Saccharopolyspora flava TaxID=95161 RepID=A0A1I6U7G6_9PSEU|nr:cysteine hydrolase [Saccharopolyspora flava]SFS97365.1 Nicotinamidase-related amidase [Saccharopolyspora flava]